MLRNSHETAPRVGQYGWAVLVGFVALWDTLAPETLTSAFERARQNPYMRPVALGALALTAAHLSGLLPKECDIFYGFHDNK